MNTARAFLIRKTPERKKTFRGYGRNKMKPDYYKNLKGIIVIINIIVVLLVVGNAGSVLPKRDCV